MGGLSGELFQELDRLTGAANRGAGPVTFRIPADHPAADRLRQLMEGLANRIERPSGLVIEREKVPNADLILLDELRRVSGRTLSASQGDRVPGVAVGAALAVEELVNREPHRVAAELAESRINGMEDK